MSDWYRPSKEPQKTRNGEKHFFRFDEWDFEVEWSIGDSNDDASTWIRPDQTAGFRTGAPDWFPNVWPRFNEVIEPETAHWLLQTVKEAFDTGHYKGSSARTIEIRSALGLT